jgi:hypothetical protein
VTRATASPSALATTARLAVSTAASGEDVEIRDLESEKGAAANAAAKGYSM